MIFFESTEKSITNEEDNNKNNNMINDNELKKIFQILLK